MSTHLRFLSAAAVVLFASAGTAFAAQPAAVCTAQITYEVNGAVVDTYASSFTIARDAVFQDDQSTPTREKVFRATLTRTADGLVLFVNYFADVSVFNSVSVDTSVRLQGGGAPVTESGHHVFSSSQAVPAGNHATSHTLVCTRQ